MLEKKIHTQLSELLTEKDYRSVKTLLTACTPAGYRTAAG